MASAPGLYFLGLLFQHTLTSANFGGIGPDARYIAEHLHIHATPHDAATATQSANAGVR